MKEILSSIHQIIRELQSLADTIKAKHEDFESERAVAHEERFELARQWKELQEKQETLSKESRDLELAQAEIDALKQEREWVTGGLADDLVIPLNIGGDHNMAVSRSLLMQIEGSKLAAMFNGRHDDQLIRDENGRVFLDYSPIVFNRLIDFLRWRRDSPLVPHCMRPMRPAGHEQSWEALLAALSLEGLHSAVSFKGIKLDLEIQFLKGWTRFCCQPYTTATSWSDLVPPKYHEGNALLVGARRRGERKLAVAAIGKIEIITQFSERAKMYHHNGVYWFCCNTDDFDEFPCFGFTSHSSPKLDQLVESTQHAETNLKWFLDGEGGGVVGGTKVGSEVCLSPHQQWEKVLFVGDVQFDEP